MSYKDKWEDKEYIDKKLDKTKKEKYRKRKVIVIEENNCEYKVINKSSKEFYIYKVDGDLISPNTSSKRCDFLLICNADNKAYFVELKGKDINKAFEQIEATLENKIITSELKKFKYYIRVVLKRCPPKTQDQKYIENHRKLLTKKYKCYDIKYSNSPLEENI